MQDFGSGNEAQLNIAELAASRRQILAFKGTPTWRHSLSHFGPRGRCIVERLTDVTGPLISDLTDLFECIAGQPLSAAQRERDVQLSLTAVLGQTAISRFAEALEHYDWLRSNAESAAEYLCHDPYSRLFQPNGDLLTRFGVSLAYDRSREQLLVLIAKEVKRVLLVPVDSACIDALVAEHAHHFERLAHETPSCDWPVEESE